MKKLAYIVIGLVISVSVLAWDAKRIMVITVTPDPSAEGFEAECSERKGSGWTKYKLLGYTSYSDTFEITVGEGTEIETLPAPNKNSIIADFVTLFGWDESIKCRIREKWRQDGTWGDYTDDAEGKTRTPDKPLAELGPPAIPVITFDYSYTPAG
jgi:hypothetical protein